LLFLAVLSAASMKNIWNIEGRGNVSTVHCFVWHLRLWRQILSVSHIFKSSVYKVLFMCMYFRTEYCYMCV